MDMSRLLSSGAGGARCARARDHAGVCVPGRATHLSGGGRLLDVMPRDLARSVAAAVSLPLLVGGGYAAAQDDATAPAAGASGVGDSYWPLDGNGGIDVATYRIRNRYDLPSQSLKGTTRITLTATAT